MTDKEKIIAEVRRLEAELRSMKNSITDRTIYRYSKKLISFIDSLPEEPASEELEEAWRAAYEKEKDEILVVYDHHAGFVAGANWQKEQMMKNVIDAKLSFGQPVLLSHPVSPQIAKDGDKVKLIIVKEDNQ